MPGRAGRHAPAQTVTAGRQSGPQRPGPLTLAMRVRLGVWQAAQTFNHQDRPWLAGVAPPGLRGLGAV